MVSFIAEVKIFEILAKNHGLVYCVVESFDGVSP